MKAKETALRALAILLAAGALLRGGLLLPGNTKAPRNLVPNGDFEKGSGDRPADWGRPDGLTTFWVKSADRQGRHVQITTDVLASQFREREDELRRAAEEKREPGPPPRRKPTREPKYDTVAGLDGVHYASAEIPFRPEKHYKLLVDVKVDGTASPKVWVKAYATLPSKAAAGDGAGGKGVERKRVVWKKALDCRGASSRWRTYSTVFQVKTSPPALAETLKVVLYPYWPPATYHFDDVRLFEISEEETSSFEEESPWYDKDFAARRKVILPAGIERGRAVLLRLGNAGLARSDARDFRVITGGRARSPLEILEAGPGDSVLLRFEVVDPSLDHFVYLGNPLAPAPREPRRALRGGLLLELMEFTDGPWQTWKEAQKLLGGDARRLGFLAPRSISLGLPPLGITGGYVGRYSGFLKVARAGSHTFETVSEGASFVVVDGKLVASWGGHHGLEGYGDGEERKKHSGTVNLEQGLHALDYVVAARRGGIHLLAWARPGEKSTHPVAPEDFVPWPGASLGPLEARDKPAVEFDWKILSDTGSDIERHDLAEVEFELCGDLQGRLPARTAWSFGDGQSAEGERVRHVYLKHGIHEARVEVTISSGQVLQAARRVASRFEGLQRQDLDSLLEKYHEATRSYDLRKLPDAHLEQLVWLRSKDYRWEQDLSSAVDAWFERDASRPSSLLERLGMERALDLLEDRRGEPSARRILSVLARLAEKEDDRDAAAAWLARLDARAKDDGTVRSAEERLEALHAKKARGDAPRRAGIFLAESYLRRGLVEKARPILDRMELEEGLRRWQGDRSISSGARKLSFDGLLREKKLDEAREELERWAWELPRDLLSGILQLERARWLLARSLPDDALEELEGLRGLDLSPGERARALLLEAEAFRAKEDFPASGERLRRLLDEFPLRPESREAAEILEGERKSGKSV